MIVIGIDPHKGSHTAVAVKAGSGRLIASKTVKARDQGHHELVVWARTLGEARAFAIADCRYVTRGLDGFLTGHGEQVVRVAPKLMAGSRNIERERGKSDDIDAVSVARAAVREGVDTLPCARLDPRAWRSNFCLTIARTSSLNALATRTGSAGIFTISLLSCTPRRSGDCLCWLEKIADRRPARAERMRPDLAVVGGPKPSRDHASRGFPAGSASWAPSAATCVAVGPVAMGLAAFASGEPVAIAIAGAIVARDEQAGQQPR